MFVASLMELLFDAKKEQYDKNSELIYSRKNNEILNNLLEKQNSLQVARTKR